ncbi:MAG: hypothetical protein OES24_02200 [Acidimicrobiia bacterium]|nr:hypothetical protein [Acidimicrobiia bacterium]
MAVDLHARATTQRDALALVVTDISDALAAARADLTRRHADPTSVATADLATQLGAAQHVDVVRARLGAAKTTEAGIRAALARITNPADAQTFEDDLRDNLIEQSTLRVELRSAVERKEGADAKVAGLSSLLADAEVEMQKVDAAVLWGKQRQDHTSALIDLLNRAPLSDAAATAAAILASSGFGASETRLDDLLPAALLARAEARFDEADSVAVEAAAHAAVADEAVAALDSKAHPTAAAVTIARREYLTAENALTGYVQSTPAGLNDAVGVLETIAGQPDLSAAQADALNPADPTPFEDAIAAESDLASALTQLAEARRAVDDADLGVLMDDPGADPAGARTALDDVINNTVAPARAAYDTAARNTLDSWEVEVPPGLWLAVRDFVGLRRRLTTTADSDTLTDLIAALDSAEDNLGTALDAADVAVRQRLHVRLHQTARRSTADAAGATIPDRLIHYVRGDGPAGRTAAEL